MASPQDDLSSQHHSVPGRLDRGVRCA